MNRAAYYSAYREANRERIAKKDRAYQQANRERISDYQRAYREANRERKQRLTYRVKIDNPRTGSWSAAEDFIALRDDITLTEMCFILQRSYSSVAKRRKKLRDNQTQPGTGAQVQTQHSKEVTQ